MGCGVWGVEKKLLVGSAGSGIDDSTLVVYSYWVYYFSPFFRSDRPD
ncbi:MAG: hypothetical protein F6J93_28815 [Oscillatoria sp. SIO1A7]|nr:hypothetical protein [Oscillatoria sp. SIO1A7]